jgi:Mn2+/Fe2+ NRAMP family transporter
MSDADPYSPSPEQIGDPPRGLVESLRYLGPGLVLTASIVGAGELVATTALGAKAGFVALWVILLSCAVKVALQLEFGRHTVQTGETCFAALDRAAGPRPGGFHWTLWFWTLLQPIKILQMGGVIGGTALVLQKMVPALSAPVWCWIVAIGAALVIARDSYRTLERISLGLILAFTVFTLASVVSLQWTSYAITPGDLAEGLAFRLPAGDQALLLVFGAFGLTGVGGDEIMQYTYWLIEKGYAAKTGRRRGEDPEWQARARGWIRVMTLDALVSMVVYTTVTAAFYVLGAAVLHARGEPPSDDQLVDALATMYTESLGPWAREIFLLGALAVLASTVFSALGAWTRMFTDAAGRFGLFDASIAANRRRSIVVLAWAFPVLWTILFLRVKSPVWMVAMGGLATAAILLIVVVGAIHFRFVRTAADMRPSRLYDAALAVSIASIAALACYGAAAAVTPLLQ